MNQQHDDKTPDDFEQFIRQCNEWLSVLAEERQMGLYATPNAGEVRELLAVSLIELGGIEIVEKLNILRGPSTPFPALKPIESVIRMLGHSLAWAHQRYGDGPWLPISADILQNTISVDGQTFDVKPRHAQMAQALVDAAIEGRWWVTAEGFRQLPACAGSNISRELKELVEQVPFLREYIQTGKGKGTRLNLGS